MGWRSRTSMRFWHFPREWARCRQADPRGTCCPESGTEQVQFLDMSIDDCAVGLLFHDVPLILVRPEAIGDVDTVMHQFDFGGLEDKLIGVAEPLLQITNRGGAILGFAQTGRDQPAELDRGVQKRGEISPSLALKRMDETSSQGEHVVHP